MILKINSDFFPQSISRLIFVMERSCNFCEVETEILNNIYIIQTWDPAFKTPGKERRKSSNAQPSILTHRVTYKKPCKHALSVSHTDGVTSPAYLVVSLWICLGWNLAVLRQAETTVLKPPPQNCGDVMNPGFAPGRAIPFMCYCFLQNHTDFTARLS
jgi:hypothetical protein